ncbi:MAG: peroxidase family protein [Gammaproteobacteria bacterium]
MLVLFRSALACVAVATVAASWANSSDVSPIRNIERSNPTQRQHRGIDPVEFRTIDGSFNNLTQTDMGAAHTSLARWMPTDYHDGLAQMAAPEGVPARMISNVIFDQRRSFANAAAASDFLWQWGQFIDHDIDLTDGMDPPEPAPLPIPFGDPWFDPNGLGNVTLSFNRSLYDPNSGSTTPREQLNEITAWIDASMVYGSEEHRAQALRTLDGTGRLRTSAMDLLPYNVTGLPNAGGDGADLFLAGDVRANEQVGLTAMHTLFVREHNRLADAIGAAQPDLDGQTVYLRARRLVIAQIQAITYREFLPLLLGPNVIEPYGGYEPTQDSAIANVFSTAAFRLGHSMLSPQLLRLNALGEPIADGHLALRDAFFAPTRITDEGGIEPVLRGLAAQICQRIDHQVIDEVRNFLFGPPGAGGFDLVSLNIHRGRDHGLPRYNDARLAAGLQPVDDFKKINGDPTVHEALAAAYPTVDDIDLWVGVVAEAHVLGSLVGELGIRLVTKQFRNLRNADRFWYERILDDAELAWVNATTLADVIRRNTDIGNELSDDVFRVSTLSNQDTDSVADPWDNCLLIDNDDQRDTDNDGYGNVCDADFNNDGATNALDLGVLRAVFLTDDEHADLNGDGIVNVVDLGLFRTLFFMPPGPSGQVF